MSTELQKAPSQIDPSLAREAWIRQRMAEFALDPANRDQAIATILFDMEQLAGSVGQMMSLVEREGLGGLVKAFMTGGRSNGKR